MSDLSVRIQDKTALISVVGLGYVGLPLATALAKKGFPMLGIDLSKEKVAELNQGESYIPDVPAAEIALLVEAGRFKAQATYEGVNEADVIFICVPTPFDAMKAPDLTCVRMASASLVPYLRRGQMIILQSTTFPGTTEEIVRPILEKSGLIAGVDFHLAFSPERIDPGNRRFNVENTPKVVGGLTPECTALASELLRHLTSEVHPVSNPRTAEMTKLLENIFRSVNIALVNELSLLLERMDIDTWEVIDAAKTKPFGFMPFYPGPGVGGHCIPVDPYYLSWKAREYDFYTKFIELAAEVNSDMPYHTVELIERGLSSQHKALKEASILILGVAFKKDIDDARNSPAERVMELLLKQGARLSYHDPWVPEFAVGGNVFLPQALKLISAPLTEAVLSRADAVVIITGHSTLDYAFIVRHASLIIDTVNATRGCIEDRQKIIRLGVGRAHQE
jgi:UDP-N-acetyl-D-glucosamine dehydrogenase